MLPSGYFITYGERSVSFFLFSGHSHGCLRHQPLCHQPTFFLFVFSSLPIPLCHSSLSPLSLSLHISFTLFLILFGQASRADRCSQDFIKTMLMEHSPRPK